MTQDIAFTPAQQALQRLAASRARLRTALLPTPAEIAEKERNSPGFLRRARALWRQWTRHSPGLRKLISVLQPELVPQPWRAAAGTLAESAAPLVRRHPLQAVVLAAVTGAFIMSSRPWRWSLVATYLMPQLAPLRNQAFGWMLSQATGAPGQALLGTVLAWFTSKPASPPPQPNASTAQDPIQATASGGPDL